MPNQEETDGYDINLRNDHWLNLGLVDNSTVIPPRMKAMASAKKPPMNAKPKPKE
jgi:hypothetical protein